MIGRAMSDVQKMQGKFNPPETDGDMAVLTGMAAVSSMRDYQKEVISYTGGRGRPFCNLKGYAPCRNQEELVMASGYDSERDLENPTGSVFCAHGAGFVVPWDQWRIISIWTAARMQRSWHRIQKTGMRFRNRRHQRRVLPGCPQAVRTGQAAEKGEKARRAFPTAEAMRRSRSFRRFLREPSGP